MITSIVFDVGETLARDDRYWGRWADWLDVPRHTLSALVGAVVAQGRDNADAIRVLRPDMDLIAERAAMEAAGLGEILDDSDLYDDVRPGLAALRSAGYRVHIAGNQTARVGELLRSLDLPADTISTSGEWGCAKPEAAFFERVLATAGSEPAATLYVGDHPKNDVAPAARAGLRTCLLRRGPWGHLWAGTADPAPDFRIDSILDLPTVLTS
ncbi:HAD family hydrolase [Streptomyces sp. 891-h]|uniref:HAD family hydrolase n=1 Tax=unclassified Streptomyces TaxID=2593676 RepID=UPI001FAA93B6|nr:HAD family hydrolase [Streptomyces sp. 891-h]UNZ19558.1 HAD family hydrolase [Streptomyces sp. 891-h]